MVSKTVSYISKIWGIISGGLLILVGIYPDEIKNLITSVFGISNETFVFYVIIILLSIGMISSIIIFIYGLIKKQDVIIQKDSFRFNKYPYLIKSKQGQLPQQMPNMIYSEITIENRGKSKIECEVEISLKNNTHYKSKVLSADSTTSPNPINISVDAEGGTMGFHPLCLRLKTFETFLPKHSLGCGGNFTGTLVRHGEYEMFGKVIYDQKQSKIVFLGTIKIPDDFLKNAKIPNDIQVIIEQGGFAVYLESYQGKTRAKFFGNNKDKDTKDIILDYLEQIPQIDEVIDDNGKLRKWEIVTKIINGSIKQVNLIDL